MKRHNEVLTNMEGVGVNMQRLEIASPSARNDKSEGFAMTKSFFANCHCEGRSPEAI